MKKLFSLLSLLAILQGCQSDPAGKISNPSDYEAYFQATAEMASSSYAQNEIKFWSDRLEAAPNSADYAIQLAGAYGQLFREDSDIAHIHTSDSLYQQALKSASNRVSLYQALAANAITRHEFKEAYHLAQQALKIGDEKSASYYLLFDAAMELGKYEEAAQALSVQANSSSFNYLIRASKMADHEGDLDKAILLMETAFEKKKNNPTLFQWGKSNLGDMYGHAGWVNDAYQAYLEVLAVNPSHWRSWQGLAWIAYAHDKDLDEAGRILDYVAMRSQDPQLALLQAELAEYGFKSEESNRLKEQFYTEASKPKYQGMYSKYLVLLKAEDLKMGEEAIAQAEAEVDKRPTPEMYDLLAWTYLQNGEAEKALRLSVLFVEDQTSEPDALYHLGMTYWYNGRAKQAKKHLNEALESSFELGPLTTQKIEDILNQ